MSYVYLYQSQVLTNLVAIIIILYSHTVMNDFLLHNNPENVTLSNIRSKELLSLDDQDTSPVILQLIANNT